MASAAQLPPVPSNYQPIFEGYWKQCDAGNTGKVVAVDAATFLKSSQLKESVLHKIWTLVDPSGRGFLDKEAFFNALRLVAVCQSGKEPALSSITAKDPLPQFNPVTPSTKPWIIDAEERKRSISMFNSLQPNEGKVTGDKAKQTFLKSGLPTDVLGKIWALSDMDADGCLTISEFTIAIHLIGRCRTGEPVPAVLPPALKIAASSISSSPQPTRRESSGEWLITPEMKVKYDKYFAGIDKDKDGFVTGDESKGLFMASNLPQAMLAQIWNLIDIKSTGKLNPEQFAVAMYLISEKVKGGEIPSKLPPNLIPPSMQQSAAAKTTTAPDQSLPSLQTSSSSISTTPIVSPAKGTFVTGTGTPVTGTSTPVTNTGTPVTSTGTPVTGTSLSPAVSVGMDSMDGFSAIKQLDTLSTELENLTRQKESLQHEVKEKEKAIIESKDEIKVLGDNLAKVQSTCQDLAREKMAAQEQLDKLDQEKASVEKQLVDARREIQELKASVEQVKSSLQGRQEAAKAQSEELQKLQSELQDLKKQESQLKIEVDTNRDELQKAQQSVNKTKAEINQTQRRIGSLKDERKSISETFAAITDITFDSTTSSGGKNMTDGMGDGFLQLKTEIDSVSAVATAGSSSPLSSLSGLSEFVEEHKEDTTGSNKGNTDSFFGTNSEDPFSSLGGFGTGSPFGSEVGGGSFTKTPTAPTITTTTGSFSDPFTGAGDPFKTPTNTNSSSDPFGGDPFGTKAPATDPFKTPPATFSSDPFQSSVQTSSDPFKSPTKDPFASNPFGGDIFSTKPTESSRKSDPFSSGPSKTRPDPFGSSSDSKTPTSKDPFSDLFGSDAFGSSSGWSKSPSTSATVSDSSRTKSPDRSKQSKRSKRLQKQEDEDLARAMAESLKTAPPKK